jgi:hypothetical protein
MLASSFTTRSRLVKETKVWLADQPAGRFEFTFTLKHGSWLNLVEGFFPSSPCVGKPGELGMACMATAIILLISALCGVCGAGIAVAIALVVWPESRTQTEV